MKSLNETFVKIERAVRQEIKLFDFSCFKEAWLNVCLHNKWSHQTHPAVYMYYNRIEIISTGVCRQIFYKKISLKEEVNQ